MNIKERCQNLYDALFWHTDNKRQVLVALESFANEVRKETLKEVEDEKNYSPDANSEHPIRQF